MATVDVPGFSYSGLYYPQILQDLLLWRRVNLPELNDEDPNEPLIQLLRAFALVGHLSNVLADHVAAETLLPTAQLRESVRAQLALIGYRLSQPIPAACELVAKLPSPLVAVATLPARSQFATIGNETTPEVVFETQAATALSISNAMTQAWEQLASSGAFTDRTADFNAAGGPVALWGGATHVGDLLYFGHDTVMFNRVDIIYTVLGTAFTKVYEYFDGVLDDTTPTSVTNLGATLKVVLTSLLGASNRTGALVRVRCSKTGLYEEATSAWDGSVNYVVVGFLGQGAPSTSVTDYLVGTLWKEAPNVVETTNGLTVTVSFTLPESVTRRWGKVAVNGKTAHWLRLRALSAGGTGPTVDRVRIDMGSQWFKFVSAQGETIFDNPAGTSTGLADQQFATGRDDVVQGSLKVTVDEGVGPVTWTEVTDFLASTPTSRDFTVDYDEDGRAVVTFGNGTLGKLPPAVANGIAFQYRRGAKLDGNVGAGTVTVNRASSSLVGSITNPRAGFGWAEGEGESEAGLATAKLAGPASLRALGRAVSAADVETLAVAFKVADGTKPVTRAKAVEEGLGPKTVQVLIVGGSGAAVPNEYFTELLDYFNGDAIEDIDGVMLLNMQAGFTNFTPRVIAVTATVYGSATQAEVEAALKAFLTPTAKDSSGQYVHSFGGTVYRERLVAEMFNAKPGGVRNVALAAPAADVVLASTELPTYGVLTITIVA